MKIGIQHSQKILNACLNLDVYELILIRHWGSCFQATGIRFVQLTCKLLWWLATCICNLSPVTLFILLMKFFWRNVDGECGWKRGIINAGFFSTLFSVHLYFELSWFIQPTINHAHDAFKCKKLFTTIMYSGVSLCSAASMLYGNQVSQFLDKFARYVVLHEVQWRHWCNCHNTSPFWRHTSREQKLC